ncbi:MAG: beta-ketoacyl-ACP synthase II [Myxococcota bacterium]|nr:beta-ketoacyl-ACP synthase II [Myxococcota bacterium]
MRRVVVTGMGLVCPLGCGVENAWQRILRGDSGAGKIDHFDVDDLGTKIACRVPRGDEDGQYRASDWMSEKEARRYGDFIGFGIAAAEQAIADSGWTAETDVDKLATGVLIGSGIGGFEAIAQNALVLEERGPRRIGPHLVPSTLINLVAGLVAIKHDYQGPNHAVVTACATGSHAVGDAARMVMLGDADVMIAGSTEAAINRLSLAAFGSARALSKRNEDPEIASRPWDRERDGFVMGEGAGMLVLEEYEHAKRRGAKIYGEFKGYGLSGDAHHITAPPKDGRGAKHAMRRALSTAGIPLASIDYINAHGTSTPLGDDVELNAVSEIFGGHAAELTMSSTKSATGHMLGAAGSCETIFSLLAMRDHVAPPTNNLWDVSGDTVIDLAPRATRERRINAVMTNSFGFGGTNASLVFQRAS